MDNLRLILLIAGMIGIALIYFCSISGQQKQGRKKISHQADPEIKLSSLHEDVSLQLEAEPLVNISALTDKEPTMKQDASPDTGVTSADTRRGSGQTEDLFPQDEQAENDTDRQEMTEPLVLHITAPPPGAFSGAELLRALALVEMEYGEMNIFHHYGTGEMKCAQALFSLANMHEPGCFDLSSIDKENIRGLSLFLRLPPPVEAQIAFELMLKTTRRLADVLGGEVRGVDRTPLNDHEIAGLRHRIMASSASQ